MAVEKRQLSVWSGADETPAKETGRAGLPKTWGVLFAYPNPDGSRKACANCLMWVRTQTCMVHEPTLAVPMNAVCGYHIYGEPHLEREHDHKKVQFLDPELSGLEQVPGGTSCDRCKWYEPQMPNQGLCNAVLENESNSPALVEALACCARWEKV